MSESLEEVADRGKMHRRVVPSKKRLPQSSLEFEKAIEQAGGVLLVDEDLQQLIEETAECIEFPASENYELTFGDDKPVPLRNWSALKHFVYYIYRHAISSTPCNSNEILPPTICIKIRELSESLIQEDVTQLYIRLVTLLREYAVIASAQYISFQSDKVSDYLIRLLAHYSAFCSAASKLTPLLREFDTMTMDRFNVNWLYLNKSIFYHHFYLTNIVLSKTDGFARLRHENKPEHKNLLHSYSLFLEDMLLLAARWSALRLQITSMSKMRALLDPVVYLTKDWITFEEHKKILLTNYWCIRTPQAIQAQDIQDLDAHILCLATDVNYVADLLTDTHGYCSCEDCLTAEFRIDSMSVSNFPEYRADSNTPCRLITCYICQDPIALDDLVSHIVTKHPNNSTVEPTRVFLTQQRKSLFPRRRPKSKPLFDSYESLIRGETAFDRAMIKLVSSGVDGSTTPIFQSSSRPVKEPFLKVASEAPVMTNDCDISNGACKAEDDHVLDEPNVDHAQIVDAYCKQFNNIFGDYLKTNNDVNNKKPSDDVPQSIDTQTYNFYMESTALPDPDPSSEILLVNPEDESYQKAEAQMLEFFRTPNLPKYNAPPEQPILPENVNPVVKSEVENILPDTNKNMCHDNCETHKESRKCGCPYCEVFSNGTSHAVKTNETRKRLRIRLHQRKEKINEIGKNSTTSPNDAKNHPSGVATISGIKQAPRVPEVSQHVPLAVGSAEAAGAGSSYKPIESRKSQGGTNSKLVITSVELKKTQQGMAKTSTVRAPQPMPEPNGPLTCSVSQSSSSLNSEYIDSRDINALLNYIEGNKPVDKAALAEKKAAKKARQREKKAQERERIEQEKRMKEEEERLKEERRRQEERLREQQRLREEKRAAEEKRRKEEEKLRNEANRQKGDKKKKDDKKLQSKDESKKNKKKKGKEIVENKPNLREETIPAMVTIKRNDGDDTPTVTITLQGSTQETDKILLSFLKAKTDHPLSEAEITTRDERNGNSHVSNGTKQVESKKKKKKNKSKEGTTVSEFVSNAKITIPAADHGAKANKTNKDEGNKTKSNKSNRKKAETKESNGDISNTSNGWCPKEVDGSVNLPNLPNLRLPPGITITKIEGPPSNKNGRGANNTVAGDCSTNATQNQQHNRNMPLSKSGVIVVDTERLIQQSITASNNKKNRKKYKKKKGQKEDCLQQEKEKVDKNVDSSSMVTLKNPIFHTLQTTLHSKPEGDIPLYSNSQQASIIKNQNGMVTIRSPRLQNPFENASPLSNFLSDLKPVYAPEGAPPCGGDGFSQCPSSNPPPPPSVAPATSNGWNAQEILSGLPGIEITKVQRNGFKYDAESKKQNEPAQVSIIPTNNSYFSYNSCASQSNAFPLGLDEFAALDNVFKPRDVPEDDMDADEREVEAFKRFCLQSVPLERKEKVAHLNVNDIVLNKKKDATYS